MTMHDVLQYAEYSLREDKEYWARDLRKKIEEIMEEEKMTKSKMRIYKKTGGYSDHMVHLFMTTDLEDVAGLGIETPFGSISLPADDILEALQPCVYEIVYEHVQRGLSND